MYQDDNFHPSQENEYKQLNVARFTDVLAINDCSVNKNMYTYVKTVNGSRVAKDGKTEYYTTPLKITYYASGGKGSRIRNAVSGSHYRNKYFTVGSMIEDLFFKVNVADGMFGQNTITLFYENPEEYERQHREQLSVDIKNKWLQKNLLAKMRYKDIMEDFNNYDNTAVVCSGDLIEEEKEVVCQE